nr:hypothetical protein [Microbacterium sp. NIBRBAC000506063]
MLWTYIHVPLGSDLDPTELVTRQIERFAPGFRDRILAGHAVPASDREAFNPSDIGGDILAGSFTMLQAARRPTLSPHRGAHPCAGCISPRRRRRPGPVSTRWPGGTRRAPLWRMPGPRLTRRPLPRP